jgi:hypothetical protein
MVAASITSALAAMHKNASSRQAMVFFTSFSLVDWRSLQCVDKMDKMDLMDREVGCDKVNGKWRSS